MRSYARIEKGTIVETIDIDGDIEGLFHPDLQWVEITTQNPRPEQRWIYQDGKFSPPAPSPPLQLSRLMRGSDAQMARGIEDLTVTLLRKGVLGKEELPPELVDRINQRRRLRGLDPV